jgi:hypothetical protein
VGLQIQEVSDGVGEEFCEPQVGELVGWDPGIDGNLAGAIPPRM